MMGRLGQFRSFSATLLTILLVFAPLSLSASAVGEDLATPETAQRTVPKLESQERKSKFDRLAQKVADTGRVRLIVGSSVERVTASPLSTPEAKEARRQKVSATQDRLLRQIGKRAEDKGVSVFETIPFVGLTADAATLETLRAQPDIWVQEDVPVPPLLVQSIPRINADDAWARGYTGEGQAVAILDTGVDYTHPFLAGKKIAEGCYSDYYNDGTSVCPNGSNADISNGSGLNCDSLADGCDHGTHVAGIAVGSGDAYSGVAKGGDLIAIQVFTEFGSDFCGDAAPCLLSNTADQIRGLERVLALHDAGATIAAVNMSLGGGSYDTYCDGEEPALTAAINDLRAAGIATVIASGNEYYWGAISGPACISSAISVGSSTDGDAFSAFSNVAEILDVVAPGSDITSSVPGGAFATWNGTSMATPHVAGAIAVIRSKDRMASVDEIEATLKSTGRTITETWDVGAGDVTIGKPRIDLDAAVLSISRRVIIQDNSGTNVASLDDEGNVILAGSCNINPSCVAPAHSLVIQNAGGGTVGYIDSNGNLCIETGDCADQSAACNSPSGDAWIIKDGAGTNMTYIDQTGDFCTVGILTENVAL